MSWSRKLADPERRPERALPPITLMDEERLNAWRQPFGITARAGVTRSTPCPEIVRRAFSARLGRAKSAEELGMDADEVLRLKQINGLQGFANRRFSRAWTVK